MNWPGLIGAGAVFCAVAWVLGQLTKRKKPYAPVFKPLCMGNLMLRQFDRPHSVYERLDKEHRLN